jgi:hypothetical protein
MLYWFALFFLHRGLIPGDPKYYSGGNLEMSLSLRKAPAIIDKQ